MKRSCAVMLVMLLTLPAQAAVEIYYLHNDHLGTPRVVTDKDQVVVWKGHMKPFGEMEVAIEDITNHRRFPGQRFDIESRLHYNYFRDYDSSLGRYIQSDPIGLAGGVSTYTYAYNNPLSWVDSLGLKPGDPFKTRGAAAKDALDYINPSSIRDNMEHGGLIYQNPEDCMFYATEAIPIGPRGGSNIPMTYPSGMDLSGGYHTHGDYSDLWGRRTTKRKDRQDSDKFSKPDEREARKKDRGYGGDWGSYIGTPGAGYLQYLPPSRPTKLDPSR